MFPHSFYFRMFSKPTQTVIKLNLIFRIISNIIAEICLMLDIWWNVLSRKQYTNIKNKTQSICTIKSLKWSVMYLEPV